MTPIRFCFFLIVFLLSTRLPAQYLIGAVRPLNLPEQLRSGNLEFSGMAFHKDGLLLLPENRADKQKQATGGIYVVPLKALSKAVQDASATVSDYRRADLEGIEKIQLKLPHYQGLEALVVVRNRFFILVETDTTDANCYLISGRIGKGRFVVDTTRLLALPRPRKPDGSAIFNAGFESLLYRKGKLYAIFEYNYLAENRIWTVRRSLRSPRPLPLRDKIPFRITDATDFRKGTFLAINYFYPLEAEKDYQIGLTDTDQALIGPPPLHPFARLLLLRKGRREVYQYGELPLPHSLWNANWEALATFRQGVLLLNDKFMNPGRESRLLYLQVVKKNAVRKLSR